MRIDRDVILDLLPLYLSDDASPATRQLVEEFAKEDEQVAALLKNPVMSPLQPGHELPKELEMKSLERAKYLLKLRSIVIGIAIFLTLLPFSIRGGDGGVRWLWAGSEAYAIAAIVLAAFAWIMYAILQRRLRVSGL